MAPTDQWLKKTAWPDHVPFKLTGFHPHNEVISGVFPSIRARAFIWDNAAQAPSELTLERKTLWLLPDDDIGLMVFTGCIPLTHLFDEPVETLLVGMDHANDLRSLAYYQQVYQKRSITDAPTFEFLKDTELMPVGMPLNVIRDLADHPDSLRYSGGAMSEKDAESFYQDIEKAIESQERQKTQEQATFRDLNIPPASPDELGTQWLASGEDTATNISFSGTSFSGARLDNKQFRFCIFNDGLFNKDTLSNCTFENCQFIQSNFDHSHWESVSFTGCLFNQTTAQESHFIHCKWEKVTFEKAVFEQPHFTNCFFDNGMINKSKLNSGKIEYCTFHSCFFTETECQQALFNQASILSCIFETCDLSHARLTESTLEKTSIISSLWASLRFIYCYFNSVTTGLDTHFPDTYFEHCSMNKMGFLSANLHSSTFVYCSMLESCCDKADFSQATLIACDMAAVRLKDAKLAHSHWQSSSVQQGLFYNADLRDANFVRCNLAGANLAMTTQNLTTTFENCLMEKTHWIPRRYKASA